MTASINVFIQEDSNALVIPSRAVNFKPDTTLLKKYIIKRAERNIAATNKSGKEKRSATADTTSKPDLEKSEFKRSFVWIKNGDTLIEKRILTGMTDDSYVKVIRGLSPDEEVITGIATGSNNNSTDNSQRSPFMPQMRRRTTTGSSSGGPRN
jgi:HlyD family secretion protein